jgi:hypothetical protein
VDIKVFISYRRKDREGREFANAHYLKSILEPHVAYVFLDPRLTPGESFDRQLDQQLEACNVLLATIDSAWIDGVDRLME